MIDGKIITGMIGVGGVVVGAAGASLIYVKKQKISNRNHFEEGMTAAENRRNEKADAILKVQKERDRLMLLSIELGAYIGKRNGIINQKVLTEIEKFCLFINDNPTTPIFLKEEFQRIITLEISFSEISDAIDGFLEGKSVKDRMETINFFIKLITVLMSADREVTSKCITLLTYMRIKILS